jgi:hypothetical protein
VTLVALPKVFDAAALAQGMLRRQRSPALGDGAAWFDHDA